jgi:peptide/nickel transport system permease protein
MTVVIANFGGFLDDALKQEIILGVRQECQVDPVCSQYNQTAKDAWIRQEADLRIEARGLNEPFITKSFRQSYEVLTLNLGESTVIRTGAGSYVVADVIWERLPRTVVLFTTATIISAVIGIWLGLRMARRALSPMDRGLTMLSITTFVVPSWVFGIFFILLFGYALKLTPSGGLISADVPRDPWAFTADFLYHLALPLATVTFSSFGGWSYVTRNLVLQIMDEDFVGAARSRGLPEKLVLRRYVLRAASPPIVTSIALALIVSWTGAIITETVFNWPGLGALYIDAVRQIDAPIIIALTVIYAELFVITIFLLDLTYGLLDPRIRAGGK